MSSFEYTITFPLKHGALETDFRNCSYVLSISLEKAFLLLTHFVLSLNLISPVGLIVSALKSPCSALQ